MTHLLIDRFRFDSFAPDSDEAGSNLLTRFGQDVYLFFVITPPEQLVERAWKRGLEFGRYKAVDDTLAHAVEAYTGIPNVFFTWVRRGDKRIHFEFLDNTVPLRRASAHGCVRRQRDLNVLDVRRMLDIERYGRDQRRCDRARGALRQPRQLARRTTAASCGAAWRVFRTSISPIRRPGGSTCACESGRRDRGRSRGFRAAALDADTIARGAVARRAAGAAPGRSRPLEAPLTLREYLHAHGAAPAQTIGSWGWEAARRAISRGNRSSGRRGPRGRACAGGSAAPPVRCRASPAPR